MPLRNAFTDPRELLVAEAIQARAWEMLARDAAVVAMGERFAKECLAAIVARLMDQRDKSIGDLSKMAIIEFKRDGQTAS